MITRDHEYAPGPWRVTTLAELSTIRGTSGAYAYVMDEDAWYWRKFDGSWVTVVSGEGGGPHTHPESEVVGLETDLDALAADIAAKADAIHTHPISDVTNLQTTLDGKAASSHTHSIANVTSLQTALDGKAASVHTHAIADVTNLQTSLDGKAASAHSHAISDVTSLQSSLDGKSATGHSHSGLAPAGGSAAQVLKKNSGTDYDYSWAADATSEGGSEAFPVGSVFIAVVSTNPGTLLGYGTWSAFAAGRVLVGLDSGQTEFDTVEETGGAKTHTLTEAEIPAHTHVQDAHAHGVTDAGHTHLTQRYPTATGGSSGFTIDTSMSGTLADNTLPTKSATTGVTVNNATAVNQTSGGGGAHNNLQPYITVYMWKRTA